MTSKARDIADLGSNDVLETTATGVDVTGTLVADGLTVEGIASVSASNPRIRLFESDTTDFNTQIENNAGTFSIQSLDDAVTAAPKRLSISHNTGDVQFYEDTGSTAKMVWDASAESLNLGGTANTNTAGFSQNLALKDLYPSITLEDTGSGTAKYTIGATSGALGVWDSSGSAYRMFIDSSGNVGIGTASPNADLDVYSTSPEIRISNSENKTWTGGDEVGRLSFWTRDGSGIGPHETGFIQSINENGGSTLSGALAFGVADYNDSAYEAMRLSNNGDLGIGTASPSEKLDINGGTSYPKVKIQASTQTSRFMRLGMDNATEHSIEANGSSTSLLFKTVGTERARLDSSGNLLVGTTSISDSRFSSITPGDNHAGYFVNASTNFYSTMVVGNDATTSTRRLIVFRQGNTTVGRITHDGSSTTYSTSSDYRLKENVVAMDSASDRVKALKPCRFNFIANPDSTVDGFLAHEAQEVVPEAVTGTKDAVDAEGNPEYQGIDQSKLVPLLTKALQEALAKIEQLETRIETLENN